MSKKGFSQTQNYIRDRTHITPSRYGGVGGPGTNDDIDGALRGGVGGLRQNNDVQTL